MSVERPILSQTPDDPSGATRLRDRPAVQISYLSTRDRGAGQFSFISQNWRGKPLLSLQVIVNLIAATGTRTGLTVYAQLHERAYPKDVKVSDNEVAALQLEGDTFHPEWNYAIKPRT